MLNSFLGGSLNHLLKQNSWALAELKAQAGKHLCVAFPLGSVSFALLESGYFNEGGATGIPDANMHLDTTQLVRLASTNFSDASLLKIDGDVDFATTLLKIFRALRWDAGEDLSRVFGDVVAERAVNTVSALWSWQKSVVENVAQTSAEFLREEQFLLAGRHEVQQWLQEVGVLRDKVACLEKRLVRLEKAAS